MMGGKPSRSRVERAGIDAVVVAVVWNGHVDVDTYKTFAASQEVRTWLLQYKVYLRIPSSYAIVPFFAYSSLFAYHITAHLECHNTPIRAPCILPARQASHLSFLIAGQALFHRPWCKRVRNGEEARPVVYPPLSRLALFVSSRRRCCVIHTSEI